MSTLNRALAMLALAALVLGLLGAGLILGSNHVDHRGLAAALTFAVGAAWIGTGLYVWWRRPENRCNSDQDEPRQVLQRSLVRRMPIDRSAGRNLPIAGIYRFHSSVEYHRYGSVPIRKSSRCM